VLVKGKLAVRLAALHDEERYDQRPAYEQKKRLYGAATFEPFKSTALRVNFESGRTQGQPADHGAAVQEHLRRLAQRGPARLRLDVLRRSRPQSRPPPPRS
jgi:transposase